MTHAKGASLVARKPPAPKMKSQGQVCLSYSSTIYLFYPKMWTISVWSFCPHIQHKLCLNSCHTDIIPLFYDHHILTIGRSFQMENHTKSNYVEIIWPASARKVNSSFALLFRDSININLCLMKHILLGNPVSQLRLSYHLSCFVLGDKNTFLLLKRY